MAHFLNIKGANNSRELYVRNVFEWIEWKPLLEMRQRKNMPREDEQNKGCYNVNQATSY